MSGTEVGVALRDTAAYLSHQFTQLAEWRKLPYMQERSEDGKTLRWQDFELTGMLNAVNTERAILSKPPVTIDAIKSADGQACGHVDYARKFPWYCAEIVHGVFPLVPETGTGEPS